MKSLFITLALLATPLVADAHPLGNFTVNRYAAIAVDGQAVSIRYAVDMAEIPAFQEIADADANGDSAFDPGEREAYLGHMASEIARGLALSVDGETLPLTVVARSLEVPPGAGGLPTLRLDLRLTASLTATRGVVEFRDANFAGRAGWREIVADSAAGIVLADATVPRVDVSQALHAYPADQLASPPQLSEARFRVEIEPAAARAPSAAAATNGARAPDTAGRTISGAERFGDRLTQMIVTGAPLTLRMILLSLLIAAALGALHALSPGHGKTVVGAYLVGARGTARHALFLGVVVTATHTLGVYLLGFVTLAASHYVVPDRLFPWISAASGALVVAIGATLASSRLRVARAAHDHHHDDAGDHAHDDLHEHDYHHGASHHAHDHHHGHGGHGHDHHHGDGDHEHGHSHAPLTADGSPLTVRSLLALGVSGGLLPCPSALVVMLAAISLGRIGFGLLLIVAFSAGLAAVLTGIGLVLVYARQFFDRLPLDGRFARLMPVASALVIMVAGLAIVAQALAQTGVLGAST